MSQTLMQGQDLAGQGTGGDILRRPNTSGPDILPRESKAQPRIPGRWQGTGRLAEATRLVSL